eukprot:189243_1
MFQKIQIILLQKNDKILFNKFINEISIDNNYIIMGEINEPWSEHLHKRWITNNLIDIKWLINIIKYIRKINVFTNKNVEKNEKFMNSNCIKHVTYSIHNKSELNSVINIIRDEKQSEGSVLYLLNKNDFVIGLCKVKASSYVVRRRIRERCKNRLFRPLASGKIKNYQSSKSKKDSVWTLNEAKGNTKDHLRKGMNQLGFVPNHQKYKTKWSEFAMGFVDWWVQYKLGGKNNTAHVDLVLLELDQRFATVLQQYADFKYKGYSPV